MEPVTGIRKILEARGEGRTGEEDSLQQQHAQGDVDEHVTARGGANDERRLHDAHEAERPVEEHHLRCNVVCSTGTATHNNTACSRSTGRPANTHGVGVRGYEYAED